MLAPVTMYGTIKAVGEVVGTSCDGWTACILHVTGTFKGHKVIFEGSVTGKDWFGIQASRTDSGAVDAITGLLAGDPGYAWRADVSALSHVRVRCAAHVSGLACWYIRVGA